MGDQGGSGCCSQVSAVGTALYPNMVLHRLTPSNGVGCARFVPCSVPGCLGHVQSFAGGGIIGTGLISVRGFALCNTC